KILGQFDKTQFTPWMDSITNTDDWKPEILSFTPISDTSLFRFRFFSGPSFQEDGWWIDDISIGLTTGLADIQPMHISVFPLPAKDYVSIGLALTGDIKLRLCDIMGKEIPQESLQFEQHENYLLLDVRQLSTGGYSLSISKDGRNIGTFPILIHK
ncbi:MAG: T9SS type A sorting domain-containing protein, partial [Ignavibacteria bacterium]